MNWQLNKGKKMKEKKKKSSFNLDKSITEKMSKKSIGSGGGNSLIVLRYLLDIDDKTRVNGLTAKDIANGIAQEYGVSVRDSLVRGFFRKFFNVGKESENSKYQAYNEGEVKGNTYFVHATQVQPMTYTLLTTDDEIKAFAS